MSWWGLKGSTYVLFCFCTDNSKTSSLESNKKRISLAESEPDSLEENGGFLNVMHLCNRLIITFITCVLCVMYCLYIMMLTLVYLEVKIDFIVIPSSLREVIAMLPVIPCCK